MPSVFPTDNITLHIFSRCIKRGIADAGFPLFESESLKWPGFVEFDDVNGKIVTYSAEDRQGLYCTNVTFYAKICAHLL